MGHENIFVEQAEYLEDSTFSRWAIEHPKEREIIRKLSSSGSKLLIGPRGSGKTTLLLKTLHRAWDDRASQILPVYVNFKDSLRLEPLYKSNSNAMFWFSQWLYLKTLVGIHESITKLTGKTQDVPFLQADTAKKVIAALQVGDIETAKQRLGEGVSVGTIFDSATFALNLTGRGRVVLLLDDAGHAFSPEQQRNFFDFFRLVKSSLISPKAAIYPGVTEYSSTFHSGHDAEDINVWIDPSTEGYLQFMHNLLKQRLPPQVFNKLSEQTDVIELLSFSAFGIPRNLLNMVRDLADGYSDNDEAITNLTLTRKAVLEAVNDCAETSFNVFRSLKAKIPIYSKFIEEGEHFFVRITAAIKEYNAKTTADVKSFTLALPKPLAPEVQRLLGLFQYSGLLMPRGDVSRGEKGNFSLFDVHYSVLIDRNAILAKKSFTFSDLVKALSKRSAHAFTRTTSSKLLGTNEIGKTLTLMLPPCQSCGTERATPEAKFCLNCGAQLTLKSTFETAVSQDISVLPLTNNRVRSIKEQSNIRTIKDLLLDHGHRELLNVNMIGSIWASRISRYAEEFIE